MKAAATRQLAHPNTVLYCLYGYYNLGYSRPDLARIYNKTERTIGNWIKVYEDTGTFQHAKRPSDKKSMASQRQWLYDYYPEKPLSYLDNAQAAFIETHHVPISETSVWRIIHDFGLIWKILERRTMHVKERDVFRFVEELSRVNWSHQNLEFLDEVAINNRGILRQRGCAMRGEMVAIRGDFQRKARISVLTFVGANGMLDYFDTEGTFDRVNFARCCQELV
ncbi:uncharacterized protein IUM83_13885 [Phytophthora cinnamomi]|uniref:uncharacterized protein n=1 Tax=Phytophthora cinnamomi TaxID=4785 RepID=UPI00355AA166|nr:hypothetical protein IUM83_13885 [Phytophthora cinnamomi]